MMHYTLHLTNQCNMACDYCYVDHGQYHVMDLQTAKKAVDLASAGNQKSAVGIIFFGGEPLTEKSLIQSVVEYCHDRQKQGGWLFHFKLTTNGLMLDEDFLKFAQQHRILIALSHDGILEAHDRHRKDNSGKGTYDLLSGRIDRLLTNQPYAPVMITINPDTVQYYRKSVEYLYGKGFKYIICSMNYGGDWDERSLGILRSQYVELAEFYFEKMSLEDKFYLSPFEVKISSHVNRDNYCRERCELGKKQISVGPDGALYPCVQFVGDPCYGIGNVETGLDEVKRNLLYEQNEKEKVECENCAIKLRCNHHCGCLNRQATGYIDRVSPVLCEHERMILSIADQVAEKLFKKRNALFIQKHYNDMYPLVSLVEDRTSKP